MCLLNAQFLKPVPKLLLSGGKTVVEGSQSDIADLQPTGDCLALFFNDLTKVLVVRFKLLSVLCDLKHTI